MAESKELQVKEKQEVASPAEQTRPGVVFTPEVDIFENEKQMNLLADMPGVDPADVKIDLNNSVLSISGEVKPFGGKSESDVLTEFEIGRYYRQFTLSEVQAFAQDRRCLKDNVNSSQRVFAQYRLVNAVLITQALAP